MTRVLRVSTGEEHAEFSCSPREAVIAAHAQDQGDFNTWDYEESYKSKVLVGRWHYFCGDFAAKRDEYPNDGSWLSTPSRTSNGLPAHD